MATGAFVAADRAIASSAAMLAIFWASVKGYAAFPSAARA
jgi:hypothetical protein